MVLPGLTATSMGVYIMNVVKEAYEKGFDVVVVNHRGLAGCPLSSPKLYHGGSTDDFREPL